MCGDVADAFRKPPNATSHRYAMSAAGSHLSISRRPNCGLWRLPGADRMSTTLLMLLLRMSSVKLAADIVP